MEKNPNYDFCASDTQNTPVEVETQSAPGETESISEWVARLKQRLQREQQKWEW